MNVCLKDGESWVSSRYVYMLYLGKTLCHRSEFMVFSCEVSQQHVISVARDGCLALGL